MIRRILAAMAVVALLYLAGCGGDDTDPGGQPEGLRDTTIHDCMADPDGYSRVQCECVIDGTIAIVGIDTLALWAADERAGRDNRAWLDAHPGVAAQLVAIGLACLGHTPPEAPA